MRYLTGKFVRKPQNLKNNKLGTQNDSPKNLSSEKAKDGEDLFRSELYPDYSPLNRPAYIRRIGLLLVLFALAASSWFCFIGPGSSVLENNLQKMAIQASVPPVFTFTPLETSSLTPKPSTTKIPQSPTPNLHTKTSTTEPTSTLSDTPTTTIEPSPTPVPIQNTPTPTSEVAGCVPAELVTLNDVGKNLCVSGRVFRTIDKSSSFIIVVVEEPQAFYFVAYDLKYEGLEKKQCVYATGEIRQLGINPIMVLSYSTPLQFCP